MEKAVDSYQIKRRRFLSAARSPCLLYDPVFEVVDRIPIISSSFLSVLLLHLESQDASSPPLSSAFVLHASIHWRRHRLKTRPQSEWLDQRRWLARWWKDRQRHLISSLGFIRLGPKVVHRHLVYRFSSCRNTWLVSRDRERFQRYLPIEQCGRGTTGEGGWSWARRGRLTAEGGRR